MYLQVASYFAVLPAFEIPCRLTTRLLEALFFRADASSFGVGFKSFGAGFTLIVTGVSPAGDRSTERIFFLPD